ncbi:MAG TPA: hypothetical protein VH307_31220 [Streptosporangiaceae bacterium]|jgi:hypothetical protein|nr:hypothetical protein [Streptosporangiaceae bacterium]
MRLREIAQQTGRAEVNLAPLLVIVGMALSSAHGDAADSMLDLLFCDVAEL